MAGQRKVSTGGSRNLKTKYEPQKKIKTVKNLEGVKSSNRPNIAEIGMQSKDNKGIVPKSTLNNNISE